MKKGLLQIALSIFIVFHLAVIVILANSSSYWGRNWQSVLLPYANTIGLNATWNFFSPDPAHTMFYKATMYFENEQGEDSKEPLEEYFPPEKEKVVVNSSKRRFLYSMRFLTLNQERIGQLMVPWMCRKYAATRVRVQLQYNEIPYLDLAAQQVNQDYQSLVRSRELINQSYPCAEATP